MENEAKLVGAAGVDEKGSSARASPDGAVVSRWRGRLFWLDEAIDPNASSLPMACYCFLTGLSDGVSFSACFIWVGFQTGNTIQLAVALARLWVPGEDHSFRIPDRQALTSVCAFNLGAILCRLSSRFGRHGPKTRAWLVGSSIAMAALTLIAACVLIGSGETEIAADRGDPGWTSARGFLALAFLSASVGLQGAVAARLGTPFATTVVITSVWIALMNNERLFTARRVPSRDRQVLGVVAIFVGGFVGRALLQAIALGIAAGVRAITALTWLLVPSPAPKVMA